MLYPKRQLSGNSGRKVTVTTPENIHLVQAAIENNPRISARRNPTGLSRSAFRRIVRNLKMVPFNVKTQQELLPLDFQRRRIFCERFLQQPRRFVQNIVFGDEAAFHMNGRINSQNNRYYALTGSHPEEVYFDVPFSKEKVSVWAGLLENGTVIEPLFYEGNLNEERYCQMLEQQIIPQFDNVWWMQDGAPCRRKVLVSNYLRETFQNDNDNIYSKKRQEIQKNNIQ